jgi:DNA-binding MurR/RpiR family transcriptional regulator
MTQAMLAALVGPGAVLLVASHSGSTREVVETVRLAKRAGASVIVLTGNPRSPITKHADVVLSTASRETLFRTEALASRLAALAIVDALHVSTALRRLEDSLQALERYEEVLARRRF